MTHEHIVIERAVLLQMPWKTGACTAKIHQFGYFSWCMYVCSQNILQAVKNMSE